MATSTCWSCGQIHTYNEEKGYYGSTARKGPRGQFVHAKEPTYYTHWHCCSCGHTFAIFVEEGSESAMLDSTIRVSFVAPLPPATNI